MSDAETLLLLGEDHTTYGEVEVRTLNEGRTACAIGPGRAPTAASAVAKFHPNEDAVLVVDDGDGVLLAVADAHHGREASHRLLRRLSERLAPDLPNLHELAEAVAAPADDLESDPDSFSETTLLVAVYQRRARRGFGLSFGDSSAFLVGGSEAPRRLARKRDLFVTPARPDSLVRDRAESFRFLGAPDRLLLVFTDGVDECRYGRPDRSIQPSHLDTLFDRVGPEAEAYARALARMAMDGVDGNPGGEDNLALAVAVM